MANLDGYRRKVMRWYRQHGRHDLPWRRTRDPYAVLVSEVMLQQTQVDRVLPYYSAWMARWPDVESLAAESPGEVIRAWAGLGYNRRAWHLHSAARAVVERHGGAMPVDEAALRRLPGVGAYTAAAVACFAGEQRTPVLDTNVGRVVARTRLGAPTMRIAGEQATRATAETVLPARGSARDWNLALMDIGAMVCKSRNPACGECPVRSECAWRLAGHPGAGGGGSKGVVRFEDTARFARGRIVAALRLHESLTVVELAALLPEHHRGRTAEYLSALERDGLAVQVGDERSWALPGGVTEE